MIRYDKMYINGEWIEPDSVDYIEVVNPATEKVVAEVIRGTAREVDLAAKAANEAFFAWSSWSVDERAHVIRALADAIERNGDEITRTVTAEMGQPVSWAQKASTATTVQDLRNFADALPQVQWVEKIGDATVHRIPAGVVGAITAWNGPIRSVCLKVGAAIAAGCTVVLKPSEVAPLTPLLLPKLAEEAGLPPGVLNIVTGQGSVVGEAMTAHPDIDMLSLTGSVGAGRRVMEGAARRVKRVALELGGKSANVILEGADIRAAIRSGVQDAFRNSGQACGALTRFLIPRERLEEVEQLAAETAESFILGDPTDPQTHLGPLANLEQYHSVRDHIQRAIDDEDVKLVSGGLERPDHLPHGFFVKPTVFSGPNHSQIAQEEVFGPVIVIIPFEDEEDAVRMANDSDYGLAGGVWASGRKRARAVAARIRTGRIRINGTPIDMRAPHGGLKLSGVGREMGRYGIEDFLEYQAVHG